MSDRRQMRMAKASSDVSRQDVRPATGLVPHRESLAELREHVVAAGCGLGPEVALAAAALTEVRHATGLAVSRR
jgi:hypothetical protein